MLYLAILAAIAVGLFFGGNALKKKMLADKESVFKFVSASKEPLKASVIGDSLSLPDGLVYRLADELVKEKRIGVMVTQDLVQGRRIRIVQYHALPS